MTWVSLRSGIASSGTVFIDHTPATTATATIRNTTKRFFAENSMMALIMARRSRRRGLRLGHRHLPPNAAAALGAPDRWIHGLRVRLRGRRAAVLVLWSAHATRSRFQLALGIDEERAGRYDALPGREPARNRHPIVEPFADDYLARLEISIAKIDEHRLAIPGVEHGFSGHEELLGAGDAVLDVHVHVRLHPRAGITGVEADLERARHRVHLWLDVG